MHKESHVVLSAQVVLNGSQEIVGLENEDHLSVDKGKDVRYFFYVASNIFLDLFALEAQIEHEDIRYHNSDGRGTWEGEGEDGRK